jgi:uncharacterized membrane protein YkoI
MTIQMTDETNSDQPVSDQLANGPRSSRRRQVGWGLGLLAGGALAGAILAGSMTASADNTSTPGAGSSSSGTTERGEGHRGHGREQVLTGDTAAKVKAAALAKVPGATVDRLEKDSDGAVYEAHLTKADGSRVTVKLDAAFAVTGVETGGPGDRDHGGPGGRGHDEVALTGSAAAKAGAAALAELPGATVERVEKDADGATYEAHVRKADGTEATVKMDAGYTVTGVEAGR